VVSALAMDYVEDWGAPLSEFRRVLKPGGKLVFSVEHPAFRFVFAAMLEPKPDERFRAADPEEYERLCRMPGFLCFVGLKPGAA
jgi:SAM-dependent methyltransferase